MLGGFQHDPGAASAVTTVQAAIDAGLRYLDTAPFYGFGAAETRVGAALAERPEKTVMISTKVGRLVTSAPPGAPTSSGRAWFDLSADGIRRSITESLERLRRTRVEILYLHDPDDHLEQARQEALPALRELRAAGVVGAIGVGMYHPGRLAALVADQELDVVLSAGRYTLLDQSALDELIPTCRRTGTAIVVGGVLNSGILADPRPEALYDYADAPAPVLARARAMAAHCEQAGTTLLTAAFRFAARHPAVSTVLLGARDPNELAQALDATRRPVPDELWERLVADGLLDPRVLEPS